MVVPCRNVFFQQSEHVRTIINVCHLLLFAVQIAGPHRPKCSKVGHHVGTFGIHWVLNRFFISLGRCVQQFFNNIKCLPLSLIHNSDFSLQNVGSKRHRKGCRISCIAPFATIPQLQRSHHVAFTSQLSAPEKPNWNWRVFIQFVPMGGSFNEFL